MFGYMEETPSSARSQTFITLTSNDPFQCIKYWVTESFVLSG